ncbi:MAG: HAD family phosphatase [Clostridia bacterium]|nr:HAD family phosphatase [Clostridia bacterium]
MLSFTAALFDMDGTLLDSMGVWADVDRHFFESRGMTVPEDYAHSISGLSFRQTAVYTKERFHLPESVDEILAEWNEMCEKEYVLNVLLKKGAKEYLLKLKKEGVKLAVATALPERLYKPALLRNGVYDLFDAFASTDEAGERKSTGRVYLLAAERLGVKPQECCVFEDITDGIIGAKNAGMKAVLVKDEANEKSRKESMHIADAYLEAYADWTK